MPVSTTIKRTCAAGVVLAGMSGFAHAEPFSLKQTFSDPTPTSQDLFGRSVAISGNNVLIGAVLDASGLEDEGDTPDGKLSVRFNTCLGACAQAPVISINHQLIGRLSPDQARAQVSGLLGGNGQISPQEL